ncbi:hypothetical protein BU16DRAFT_5726 [Lophium mytilinum]|uniref:Uncharacterized protein n=1 Tax=Lophium mytilinum TaxID=390894 RepID=A0A6A6RBX3_9PEZI|nr:hypothetical protein BU16DRAFT_5726 [Lophium mytilinum]
MAQAHEEQRSPAGGGGQLSAAVEEQQQQAGLRVLSSSSSSLSSKPLNTPETKPQNTSIGTAHPQLTSPSTFTASGHSDKSPAARTKENSSLDPDPPQQSLSHRPSITFSSASSMDRRRARRVPADGDGSADETVPIISREQGGHARDYQSISPQIRAKHAGGTAIPGNGVNRERQEREAEAAAVAAEAKEGRWWKKVIEKYGSVELENKGSVARDHLALGMCSIFLLQPH